MVLLELWRFAERLGEVHCGISLVDFEHVSTQDETRHVSDHEQDVQVARDFRLRGH